MLSCSNAIRPPKTVTANKSTIRMRRRTARATRRSIETGSFKNWKAGSASGRRAIDEETASRDDLIAGLKVALHFDKVAVGETSSDLTQFDGLVAVRDPDAHLIAFIDQGLLGHA